MRNCKSVIVMLAVLFMAAQAYGISSDKISFNIGWGGGGMLGGSSNVTSIHCHGYNYSAEVLYRFANGHEAGLGVEYLWANDIKANNDVPLDDYGDGNHYTREPNKFYDESRFVMPFVTAKINFSSFISYSRISVGYGYAKLSDYDNLIENFKTSGYGAGLVFTLGKNINLRYLPVFNVELGYRVIEANLDEYQVTSRYDLYGEQWAKSELRYSGVFFQIGISFGL